MIRKLSFGYKFQRYANMLKTLMRKNSKIGMKMSIDTIKNRVKN